MANTIAVTTLALLSSVVFAGLASAVEQKSDTCFDNGPNEHTTLRGLVVQSITTENNDGLGEPAGTKYAAIALDEPICFRNPFQKASVVKLPPIPKVFPVPTKWLGHHVSITGNLVLDEDLSLEVERIQDIRP